MAESTKTAAKRRAQGRDRRRSMLTEPFERLDEATGDGESSGSVDVRETLKHAAVTAAAAAAIGAAAGAAKALLDRRDAGGEDDDQAQGRSEAPDTDEADTDAEGSAETSGEDEQRDEPQARADARDAEPRDEDEDEEPQGRAEPAEEETPETEDRAEDTDGDEQEQPRGRAEDDDDERADQPQGRAEDDDEDEQQQGRADLEDAASADSDPSEIVPKAREELERLLGREAESVSGFERQDGHWNVTLEVVEVRRIPDSTDVLASYEVTLDDDGRLARMTRTRRYRRSQLEGQG